MSYVFPQIKLKIAEPVLGGDEGSTSTSSSLVKSSSSSSNGDAGGASQLSVTAVEYKYQGAKRLPAGYPLLITALVSVNYFQVRPPFSLVGMLMGNPMILMMLVGGCAMVYLPKMMAGLDPEALKELEAAQAASGGNDPTSAIKKMFGMEAKEENDD